jgi:hypothetical protein
VYTTRFPSNIYILNSEDQGEGILADFRGVASSWNAIAKLGFKLQDYGLIGEVRIVPHALRMVL